MHSWIERFRHAAGVAPVLASLLGLLGGVAAWLMGLADVSPTLWSAITALALPLIVVSLINGLRQRRLGVDVIALLALVGALAYHQPLAGALIATMFTTGQALETFAHARARGELTALLARAPRTVHRYQTGSLVTAPASDVQPGDRLLVTPGEVVAVDGVLAERAAVLDESALTGESMPVEHRPGTAVLSGAVNAGGPFDLVATADVQRSTYAGIVRLVQEAEASKAPLVRLADRYALIFLPLTLAVASAAWLLSGDPVRALAVLVVATPCPLILAAPVAIISGISRAAGKGIIAKSGAALETLGQARVLLFDKTGTLTTGSPVLSDVETFGEVDPPTLLRLAASLDQVSSHVLASAIVTAARRRDQILSLPAGVREEPGAGITGLVDGHSVALGKASWVAPDAGSIPTDELQRRAAGEGRTTVFCSIDGKLAGVLLLEDPIRADAAQTVSALRRLGIGSMRMLTGDHAGVAERVGAALGLDGTVAQLSPAGKIEAVRLAKQRGTAVMVGDGINDAPALAAADVGVAMGARGATASSEAADVVIVADRLDRLVDAMAIAQRARAIAVQSVTVGMGLSLAAMVAALAGMVPPATGALLQEAIDLAVILNALRALGGGGVPGTAPMPVREPIPDREHPAAPRPLLNRVL